MSLVEQLVRAYSPSGSERSAVRLLLNELTQRGFRVQEDEVGNAIGRIGNGPTQIYLVGHIDTVPGVIPVFVEDGILYGRGSVDAKGCLASFGEAAKHFKDSQEVTITVVGCVGEESDSRGAYHLKDSMPVPDYVVIGEPSGWEGITLGYRGVMWLEYEYESSRHHHGNPEPTPSEVGVKFYTSIFEKYAEDEPHFDNVSLRLVDLNTYQHNGNIGITMKMDLRTPPGFDYEAFMDDCNVHLNGATLTTDEPIHAVLTDKHNPLVRSFLGGIRANGGTPVFKKKTGSADMNILANWGCPMLAYGPGDSALDHTVKEHLILSEYERSIEILKTALQRLGQSS